MSKCKCDGRSSCKSKCKEPCEDCTCNKDKYSNIDKPHIDGAVIKDIMQGNAPEHLSYCYSNTRAPGLWMKKALNDFKRVGFSLKDSKFCDLSRDMEKFTQVYVNNTVLMSQEVSCGMFSVFEYAELQKNLLEMFISFCKNHIMEIFRGEVDKTLTFEQAQLLIDCVGGDDFQKSSMILSRPKLYKEEK